MAISECWDFRPPFRMSSSDSTDIDSSSNKIHNQSPKFLANYQQNEWEFETVSLNVMREMNLHRFPKQILDSWGWIKCNRCRSSICNEKICVHSPSVLINLNGTKRSRRFSKSWRELSSWLDSLRRADVEASRSEQQDYTCCFWIQTKKKDRKRETRKYNRVSRDWKRWNATTTTERKLIIFIRRDTMPLP